MHIRHPAKDTTASLVGERTRPGARWEFVPHAILVASVLFDGIARLSVEPAWSEAGFWVMATGLVIGFIVTPLLAPKPSVDSRPDEKATILLLCAFSLAWLFRRADPGNPGPVSLALSLIGVAAAVASLGFRQPPRSPRRSGTARGVVTLSR